MLQRHISLSKALLCALALSGSAAVQAITIVGSGTGTSGNAIGGRADFVFAQHDFGSGIQDALLLTVTNVSTASTAFRGNLLTSVFFSIDGVNTLGTTAASFDGLAATVRTSNTASVTNVDIGPAGAGTANGGAYLLANGPFGVSNSGFNFAGYKFGIATVGMGLTGFGGLSGGDNYGIATTGANLTLDGLGAALPVISGSAQFWMLRPAALTSLDQISTDVRFGFGSNPDNIVNTVPEPTSMALAAIGLIGLAATARRRARKLA